MRSNTYQLTRYDIMHDTMKQVQIRHRKANIRSRVIENDEI